MAIFSMAISFAITVSLMPFFIGYFNYKKIGQITREEGPVWHEVKTGTPTMGGSVFVFAIIVTSLVYYFFFRSRLDASILVLSLTFLLFGGIGFLDDFISIFMKRNQGLSAKQKFLAQLIFSGLLIFIAKAMGIEISLPLFGLEITSSVLLASFAFLWITGFSNAVNLTDGLDGLATGLNIIAYGIYAILAYRQADMSIMLFSLMVVGALIGFLIYNHKPAKIFMGDVGSLALGAGLAVMSILLNNPWTLLVIGFVFVGETLSVILQVTSFKLRGKRIFKMSPIHHHFEMSGWSETKVVRVFWLVGLVMGLISLMIF